MKKVFIAGHNGMVGSAISSKLSDKDVQICTAPREELDLLNQSAVEEYFTAFKFDQLYLCAAKVGGIHANSQYPAEFIYQNLMIQNNIIHSSYKTGIDKLLFLGSSCIYPKFANQPISEDQLLNGYLEETNEPYAIAKISGIKLCESYNRQYGVDYRSVMPTNLYGPGDNFSLSNSHVIPALIKKFHHAKVNNLPSVSVWGTGQVYREFLHVDDMADACIYIMNIEKNIFWKKSSPRLSHINIGSGEECSIAELAKIIAKIINYDGDIEWDKSKPDGTPRKLLDISKLNDLGWHNKLNLKSGIKQTYDWFLENIDSIRNF